MKKSISIFMILMIIIFNLYAEGEKPDALEKTKPQDNTLEYWFYGSVPVVVLLWGIGAWGWGTSKDWQFNDDGWGIEQDSYTGGADKFGHLWGIYLASRIASHTFEKNGNSRNRSALKGFLFSQIVGLGIEIGDGFGDTYGFSWGDMVWNLGGGLFALLMDIYPPLDELLAFQIEYWPSEDHMNQKATKKLEITSDVTGQKFILSLKFRGMPYIRDTIMQYFQIDCGFYTRGYWFSNSTYKYKSRHAYIGFAFNLSRISERIIPAGTWRNGFSSFFKYYHPPFALNPDVLDYTFDGKTKNAP
ncbi:MAG: DUF2279 domain-containing protein [Spirochaetota bacterium]|nr:DUF2279 domain-containing protein [Spirochaetota bacterium]